MDDHAAPTAVSPVPLIQLPNTALVTPNYPAPTPLQGQRSVWGSALSTPSSKERSASLTTNAAPRGRVQPPSLTRVSGCVGEPKVSTGSEFPNIPSLRGQSTVSLRAG